MARVARPSTDTDGDMAGVYAHLLRYYEADLADWVANVNRSHWARDPFPRQRILDRLRASRTVNVPTYALPPSALAGAPSRLGPPRVHGPKRASPTVIRRARAVVRPDDTVTYTDEDAMGLWLEENGLAD